jgi:hypothetical protein
MEDVINGLQLGPPGRRGPLCSPVLPALRALVPVLE